MSTATNAPQLPAPIVGKFNLSLTETGFQKLADREKALVYNEDNLTEIKQFLDDCRAVEKGIEKTHEVGKAPAWKECKDWDLAKNTFMASVAPTKNRAQEKYTKLCKEIEERQKKQDEEKARKQRIKDGIETNAITFAKKIADCKTSKELTDIERVINLEKTRKDKYEEFLEQATTRYTELNKLLAEQKVIVKELEDNARQQEIAKQQQDDAKLLELQQQQEQKEAQIEENSIKVQETAIAQSVNAAPEEAPEVIPTVTAKRTTWEFEVVSEKEVIKKAPELILFTIDKEKVKANLKLLKDSGQLTGKTEITINGIRYFEKKSY
jgi:hypothetical protein